MSNQSTAVNYQIRVDKVGVGATQAVTDFKAVEAAAQKTNATLAGGTNATAALNATTKTATSSLKAMQGTLTLIGLQTFPQLTLAATTAQQAIAGIKTASAAAGVGLAAMGAQLAVITAGAYAAVRGVQEFISMMGAMKGDEAAAAGANESDAETRERFKARIMAQIESGQLQLTEEEAGTLDRLLEHNQFKKAREIVQGRMPTGEFMSDSEKNAEARRRLGALDQQNRFDDAVNGPFWNTNTASGKSEAIERVQQRSLAYNEELIALQKEGILNETQMQDLMREGEISRRNSITEIKAQLTDLQVLGQDISMQFAGGFSQAFVSFLDGSKSAKEAFTDFARQFLSQVAQMIIQMLILKAIKAAFGGALGLAEGGVAMAASGGMFPRFAANGLRGVSSVSSATYFPRFNVVAGEAGREMLTVLARPRMMEVGGMQAVVGSAQGQQLAITDASALNQSSGKGGTIVIQIQGTPDYEARVVKNSVKGAVVQVANDMRQDTPISRGVKGLTA